MSELAVSLSFWVSSLSLPCNLAIWLDTLDALVAAPGLLEMAETDMSDTVETKRKRPV
ncbi:hypothetical protein AX13_13330 [Comamonas aquatica DA1877]|uniref:Uncharacterized protein n=1 Tax=Comamonas aquatica DA1877 TaxID=1457173 RepID=A0A014MSY0_9BURK|nr:hypothetical protein AX13_13330 [Comamonas aquatica DA1877]